MTTPWSLPDPSITGSPLTLCWSISRTASITEASGAIDTTSRVMTSDTFMGLSRTMT